MVMVMIVRHTAGNWRNAAAFIVIEVSG
jgi:hypothetical protein